MADPIDRNSLLGFDDDAAFLTEQELETLTDVDGRLQMLALSQEFRIVGPEWREGEAVAVHVLLCLWTMDYANMKGA